MKIIKCIAEKIREEIHDAEEYMDLAIAWKEEEPDAAEIFNELAQEELGHMEKLHELVTGMIDDYKEEHGEPPAGMMALYEYMHEQSKENAMRVKVKQAMFKEA